MFVGEILKKIEFLFIFIAPSPISGGTVPFSLRSASLKRVELYKDTEVSSRARIHVQEKLFSFAKQG